MHRRSWNRVWTSSDQHWWVNSEQETGPGHAGAQNLTNHFEESAVLTCLTVDNVTKRVLPRTDA